MSYANGQGQSAGDGSTSSLGREPILRQLRWASRCAHRVVQRTTGRSSTGFSELGSSSRRRWHAAVEKLDVQQPPCLGHGQMPPSARSARPRPAAFGSIGPARVFTQTRRMPRVRRSRSRRDFVADKAGSATCQFQAATTRNRASLRAQFTAADLAMTQLTRRPRRFLD